MTTLDIQPELKPDLVGSVTAIPAEDGAFDVALCSQVLEHLPFDQFGAALRELRRVTKFGLVLSLPDISPYYYLGFRLPKMRPVFWSMSRRKYPSEELMRRAWESSGHYWEIGYRDSLLDDVRHAISEAGWLIHRAWRVPEKDYHRFFKLCPETGS